MSKPNTKINFFYNMIYQLLLMILPLITAPYIARVIGAEGVGIFTYTRSVAQYFLYIAMLGLNNYGNRSIARVRDKGKEEISRTFSSIFYFQILTSIIAIFIYIIYLFVFVKDNLIIAAFQLIYIISAVLDINWLFFGLEEFKVTVTRKIIIKILNVICIFLFVKTSDDLWKYTLVMCAGFFIGQSFLFVFVKKYVSFGKIKFSHLTEHIKPNLVLFIPIIATSIYRVMDKVMIGQLSTMVQVGYYENSEKLINVSLCAVGALGTVLMPKVSNLVARLKIEESKTYIKKSMEAALFMGCAIAFGISSIAGKFIPIFYGEGYEPCIRITKFLSLTVFFISWASVVRMQYLIPFGKERIYVSSVCVGAILNVLANLLLIERLGAMGAVYGTIITEVSVAVFQTIKVYKELDILIYLKSSIVFIIAGLLMYVTVKGISKHLPITAFALLVEVSAGASIYLSICTIYFIKSRNELFLSILNKIIPQTKSFQN